MLSGTSFRSAFVFSINSLILPGFPLTCFHLAEPHYLLFRGFILWIVQLSKNITKFLLFIIIHIFSTHFAINLFYLHNMNKLRNNNRIVHANERNQNKNKTKSRHIQIDHALDCSIQLTNNAIVSLKGGFTV